MTKITKRTDSKGTLASAKGMGTVAGFTVLSTAAGLTGGGGSGAAVGMLIAGPPGAAVGFLAGMAAGTSAALCGARTVYGYLNEDEGGGS